MKLIASSQVPVKNPYLHLAYTVARIRENPQELASSPFFITGLIFLIVVIAPLKWLKKNWLGKLTFWCGMIAGIFCLLLGMNAKRNSKEWVTSRRKSITYDRMHELASDRNCRIDNKRLPKEEGKRYPASDYITITREEWKDIPFFTDFDGNIIMIQFIDGNYQLTSAGRDKQWNTKDDLVVPCYYELKEPKEEPKAEADKIEEPS